MTGTSRFTATLGALVLLVACTNRDKPLTGVGVGGDIPVIDAVFATWDVPGSPGCALAVAQDGVLIYTRGYGYANLDYDIPITPKTVFDVASITKQFNAASIIMLEQDGKLSLDDNVRKWLPELPEFDWPITLRHMLQHTSGLRDYLSLFPLAGRSDYYPISHPQMLGLAMNEADIESIMSWPHTVISSDGELAGVHPRGFGAFTRYLGHYIRDRNVLSLEQGIRRMTSLSAQHMGITERGAIDVGYYADLVLFDPEKVVDRSSPEFPHVPSVGIDNVWVNGQLVFESGQVTGSHPGKVIRRENR